MGSRTPEEKKAADVFEGLVDRYMFDQVLTDHARMVEHAVQKGTPIPERLLPGRVIMALPPDERAALANLTSEMAFHRYRR